MGRARNSAHWILLIHEDLNEAMKIAVRGNDRFSRGTENGSQMSRDGARASLHRRGTAASLRLCGLRKAVCIAMVPNPSSVKK